MYNQTCIFFYANHFWMLKTDIRQVSSRLINIAKENSLVCLHDQGCPSLPAIRLVSWCQSLSYYQYIIKPPLNFKTVSFFRDFKKQFLLVTLYNVSSIFKWSFMFMITNRWLWKKTLTNTWFLIITQKVCRILLSIGGTWNYGPPMVDYLE